MLSHSEIERAPQTPRRAETPKARVLIVDDDPSVSAWLEVVLERAGFEVSVLNDAAGTMNALRSFHPNVLILDVLLPGTNGFDLMAAVRLADPLLLIIFITAAGSIQDAVRALRAGAETYLTKPLHADEIVDAASRALDRASARDGNEALHFTTRDLRTAGSALIGRSELMRALQAQVLSVGQTDSNVLIRGEIGTGKNQIARAVHNASARAPNPFVQMYCGAHTEESFERELFGAEPGAIPGLESVQLGLCEQAHGGTLHFDEVAEVPRGAQDKLLRLVADGTFTRIGSSETRRVDVRVIASTTHDLRAAVSAGTVREDLFHRLNAIEVDVPSLRLRRADIPLLIDHLLESIATKHHVRAPLVTAEARRLLLRHNWPGNVRELRNVLERAVVLSRGAPITAAELSTSQIVAGAHGEGPTIPGATFAELERHAILMTYDACGHNVTRTAEVLGLSPRTIHYRLREYQGRTGRRIGRGIARRAAGPEGLLVIPAESENDTDDSSD